MHDAKRVALWALALVLVAAAGCAQQNQNAVTLEQQNDALRAQMKKMSTQLAAATQEAQDAKRHVSELNQCLIEHIQQLTETQVQEEAMAQILREAGSMQGGGSPPAAGMQDPPSGPPTRLAPSNTTATSAAHPSAHAGTGKGAPSKQTAGKTNGTNKQNR